MFFWKHVSEVHFSSKREQNLPRLLMEQLQCQLVVVPGPGKQGSEFESYQLLSNLGKDILFLPQPFPCLQTGGHWSPLIICTTASPSFVLLIFCSLGDFFFMALLR